MTMLTAYDSAGVPLESGQTLTGRDGAAYEFIEVTSAPTATTFGKVRMRKLAGREESTVIHGIAWLPRHSSMQFADIAFDLTIRTT
jgi:hypothetical protein